MRIRHPFLVAVTFLNVACAGVSISQQQLARASDDSQVLRGRSLEIVDEKGRVRASIKLHPAERAQNGTMTDETAVLRLITTEGKPGVKIAASETTAGIALVAEQGNYIQVFTDGVKLTQGGKQRALWP